MASQVVYYSLVNGCVVSSTGSTAIFNLSLVRPCLGANAKEGTAWEARWLSVGGGERVGHMLGTNCSAWSF